MCFGVASLVADLFLRGCVEGENGRHHRRRREYNVDLMLSALPLPFLPSSPPPPSVVAPHAEWIAGGASVPVPPEEAVEAGRGSAPSAAETPAEEESAS